MSVAEIYNPPQATGKDYVIQVRVKNGPLLRAMQARGMNGKLLAKLSGVSYQTVHNLLALKRAPIRRNGEWTDGIIKISAVLRLPPECLCPEAHLRKALARSSGEVEASRDDMAKLIAPDDDPETGLIKRQMIDRLVEAIGTLTPRQQEVLKLRYGLEDGQEHTLKEVGRRFCVSSNRIRQIEQKAFRLLRHPSIRRRLEEAGFSWRKPPRDFPPPEDHADDDPQKQLKARCVAFMLDNPGLQWTAAQVAEAVCAAHEDVLQCLEELVTDGRIKIGKAA